jgi:hypothetical protein
VDRPPGITERLGFVWFTAIVVSLAAWTVAIWSAVELLS